MFQSVAEAVFHYASTQPDRLCLVDDGAQATYAEYARLVARYAALFAREGFSAEERVVVEACQTIEYLAVQLALQLNKVVFVPVEFNCARDKIASIAAQVEASAIIVRNEGQHGAPRVYTYAQLTGMLPEDAPCPPDSFPRTEDVSEILFTTGTTGKEKGIVLTNANNIALAGNVIHGVEMEPDNREIIPSPMNHSHGLRRYYANMVNGSTVLLLGRILNVARFFELLDKYGANSADLVPTALAVLLKLSGDKLGEYKDVLRYIQLGAAPMIEADQQKICRLLPDTRLYNFYGSTESGCICIYNFNRPDSKKNCIGKGTYNAQIVMVDDDHRPITATADNPGLLSSRGGMNMLHYWKDPQETARVLDESGAVYTNDVAYFDADGDIILLGRKGDVINIGGKKVSPEEIENAAKLIPGVADCGVIPVPDPMQGNVPKLFVQMQPGAEFVPSAIRTALAKSLEPFKVPTQIVSIEKIPRSYNGKILRRELKG